MASRHRIICKCKNWATNIPREIVHAFRTVMQKSGAHRGYIISRMGFQQGAIDAAHSTNIELVTFADFQIVYELQKNNERIQMKLKKTATSVMVAMTLTFSAAVTKSYAEPVTAGNQTEQIDTLLSPIFGPVPLACGEGPCFVI